MIGTLCTTQSNLYVSLTSKNLALESRLKQLGGKSRDGKVWTFPKLRMYARQIMRELPGLIVDGSADDICHCEWGFRPKPISTSHRSWPRFLDHQHEAVTYLISSPHRGTLLALSPGSGKTATVVVAADILQAKSILVLAPLSLLRTWRREIQTWGDPSSVELCHSCSPTHTAKWTVANYETVVRRSREFTKQWDIVILDESIMVKSRSTVRFKKLKGITATSKKIWLLSGSPTSRAVDDLWSQFHLIAPAAFTSYWRFAESYCIIESPPWGKGVVGSKRNIDFKDEFSDLMYVKNIREVVDLPESFYETVDIELEGKQKKVYEQLQKDFIAELEHGQLTVTTKVAQLVKLQQIVSNLGSVDDDAGDISAKSDALVDLLDSGHIQFPLLVWVHWTTGAKFLESRLLHHNYDAALVTGETDKDVAAGIIEDFVRGDGDILILSIGVGKYGHTLTNVKTIVYYEKTFNMDAFVQSSYRVTRLGLKHNPVVITFRCPHTTDELVEDNLAGKSVDVSKLTNSDLAKMLANLGRI